MGFNGFRKSRQKPRGSVIAALDVGTSKICCFIARIEDDGEIRVIGVSHQLSHGLRAGMVVDMEAAEAAICHAVHAAEQMAGETIRDVVVNISGNHAHSQSINVEVPIGGGSVTDADLHRALAQARTVESPGESELIHAIPVGYALDGNRGIRDPRGMFGQTLGLQLHAVTAGSSSLKNLTTCIARSHLNVEGLCLSPYASGLACLVDDETDLGCTVIDMGGGTTGIAVFLEGALVYADSLPIGGSHVTSDIARGLTTPIACAERIKTLYGSALAAATDERELIDVPQVGEDEAVQANHVPRSLLVGIIQPRLEETFELVRSRLEASGFSRLVGRRVVLTGGASQLPHMRELAQLVLDKQVRLGRPIRIANLAESTGGPAFSTAAGLLAYAVQHLEDLSILGFPMDSSTGLWNRVGSWLRENL